MSQDLLTNQRRSLVCQQVLDHTAMNRTGIPGLQLQWGSSNDKAGVIIFFVGSACAAPDSCRERSAFDAAQPTTNSPRQTLRLHGGNSANAETAPAITCLGVNR